MESKLGVQVRYLFNSGFTVKTGRHLLVFDYYNPLPLKKRRGLDSGVIVPEEISDIDVTVFASHAHMDHFTPAILNWGRTLPSIRYVLSHDIDAGETANVTTAYPSGQYDVGSLTVTALKSTDEGVAFVVETDGLKLYHAGDLNWWHWEGEPEDENNAMGEAYRNEIDKLGGMTFDLAFVPVDPRLKKEYFWGLDYFMKKTDARIIFPMHFRSSYSVIDRLIREPAAQSYRDRIVRISHRGESFEV